MDVRFCDMFLIVVARSDSCWVFLAWLAVDAARNSRSCSSCLVILSDALRSFSVTTTAISSAKIFWNSPTIKKATALITWITWSSILASKDVEISRFARVSIPKLFSRAIKDLCSRKSLASLAFLTRPVVAASLAARLVLLGKLTLLVTGVPDTLLRRAPPLLVDGVALPVGLSGIPDLCRSGIGE